MTGSQLVVSGRNKESWSLGTSMFEIWSTILLQKRLRRPRDWPRVLQMVGDSMVALLTEAKGGVRIKVRGAVMR